MTATTQAPAATSPRTAYGAELVLLVIRTAKTWWRLLPQVIGLYLLGWLAQRLVLSVAVIAGDYSAWLALVLFSGSFVCQLVATVLILRLAERELSIRQMIPQEELTADGRETSVTRLLSVTLLPFLGIYAAFGEVADAARSMQTEQTVRYGIAGDQQTVLGLLNSMATQHLPWLLALIVGTYVLRRVVDYFYDRTERSVLAILAILIEAFFLLMIIMGGVRAFQIFRIWLDDRVVASWWDGVGAAVGRFFARFAIDLPQIVDRVFAFIADQVWPVFWEVLSQPIIWLAVAALVFGSRVLSLAELWRRGRPVTQVIPGLTRFAHYRDKLALRPTGPAPRGVRLAGRQFREAFLGDIDDKYLPTLHSIRLVLRAGGLFLGSYVLVYSLVVMAENYVEKLTGVLLGGHLVRFWISWGPMIGLLQQVLFETLRFCLLAVAFHRCLELFRTRAGVPVPGTERVSA